MKTALKRTLAATALTLFGFAPTIGWACEYESSAAAAVPPAQLASTPVPAASVAPSTAVLKAPAPKSIKQVSAKIKESAPDAKIVVVSNN